jgi:hypothetical protein
MTHPTRAVLAATLALWTAGCSKGDTDTWKPFEYTAIGVVVDAPGNARESALGGGISASEGDTDCSASIRLVTDQPLAYENLLDNVDSIGGAIKDIKKEKTDANHWSVEFVGERKSGFQRSQRLGDKVVQCGGFGSPDAVACMKKVCASLKPLAAATRP